MNTCSDIDESKVLEIVGDKLRDKINLFNYNSILTSCIVFDVHFTTSVIAKLIKALKSKTYIPEDLIVKEGEISRKIYFVITGSVFVFNVETHSTLK